MVTIDQLRAFADDLPTRVVDVPGLGKVKVRALTTGEVRDILRSVESEDGGELMAAVLAVAYGAVDPVIGRDEVPLLLNLPPLVIRQLGTTITELSGANGEELALAAAAFRGGA
jgi:hypothetical protein